MVNIVGGLNVLRASVDAGVRKFIFSSTGGALYGEPDVVPADEDHPIRPLSPYGTSKFSFEQYLGTFHRTFGLEYTVLRYANIYGPRQDFHAEEGRVIAIFASRMLAGRPGTIDGDGEHALYILHYRDVVVADSAALGLRAGGTYAISTRIPAAGNDLIMAGLTAVQGLAGLAVFALGHPPGRILHVVYGIFAVIFLPGAYLYAQGGSKRREAVILAGAAWIVAIAYLRGISTG